MRLGLTVSLGLIAAGCGGASAKDRTPTPAQDTDARAGLLRDFFPDGKFDEAGRPLSAHVTVPGEICAGTLLEDGSVRLEGEGCDGPLTGSTQRGEIVLDVGIWATAPVTQLDPETPLATIEVVDSADQVLSSLVLTAGRVRADREWIHLSLRWRGGADARLTIRPTGDAELAVGSLEVFPARFKLALGPGSILLDPTSDLIAIEWPLDQPRPRLQLAEADLSDAVAELVAAGAATQTQTTYRQLLEVPLEALLQALADVRSEPLTDATLSLQVRSTAAAARMQVRRTEDPCTYEGDPEATTKVLVTGFEPFPADAWHENVSGMGVRAIDPANLTDAQIMRLVLPVEYDTTADRIVDVITRCTPDVVVDFGQGSGQLALEETAYNLKDTGEVPGGAPDNRGVIATATPIDPTGPAERATSLPLDAMADAVQDVGRSVRRSDDPGRYICNNVFYRVMEAVEDTDVRAGFVHLPYVTRFDDDATSEWGRTLEAIVQAIVDAD